MKTYFFFILLILFLTIFLLPKQLERTPPTVSKVTIGKLPEGFESGLADATLSEPRKPYHLLKQWLPDAPRDKVTDLTAGCCYASNFQSHHELTGTYRQMTNNYRHAYPDNCSAPLTQFVTAFYKVEPLNS